MKKNLFSVATLVSVFFVGNVNAALVDLSTWTSEGQGTWVVANDNNSVTQTENSLPTVFFNGENSQNQQLSGEITVNTRSDDDFIGFVLGYNTGDLNNDAADYLLIDWRQAEQNTAEAGLAISRVTGAFTNPSSGIVNSDFWTHVDGGIVEELARGATLGLTGWSDYATYSFDLLFTSSLVEVYVNDILELSVSGSFNDGSFGFYNLSQDTTIYSSFTQQAVSTTEIPEPSSLAIFAVGLLGFAGYRKRNANK
ncbi:PEP-CTERM sorting domain-containing protein [Vibrio sp. TH_r3]|uniref:PEP-CTERM sorting domain-containing protein n=1 Tax=Vibrio sp. TH_r3 TaxID=3082084 RepID=UPI00295355E7|nr:PEP-CTERM sorting domain-containing protein [Vibrio sp. TH_r3]MDV7104656.1 PEP-CTERM sorting domain-containing protein [Vibrio sp. TH_r3]